MPHSVASSNATSFRPDPRAALLSLFRLLLVAALLVSLAACAGMAPKSQSPAPPAATTEEERQGDYVFQAGRPDQAVEFYDRALQSGASRSSVAYRKGFAFFTKSAWPEALAAFEEAVAADPKLTVAYEGAGISAFQSGKLENASTYLNKAIQLAPKHWPPYVFLSAVQYALGQAAEAQKLQEKAFALAGKENSSVVQQTLYNAFTVAERVLAKRAKELTPAQASSRPLTGESGASAAASQPDKAKQGPLKSGMVAPPVTTEELIAVNIHDSPAAGPAPLPGAKEKRPRGKESSKPGSALSPASAAPTPGPAPATAASSAPTVHPDFGLAGLLPPPGKEREPLPAGPAQSSESAAESKALQIPPASATEKASGKKGKKSAERSAATAPAPSAEPVQSSGPPASFVILESSSQSQPDAAQRVEVLKAKGLPAFTVSVDLPGRGTWHRVLFGPFTSFDEAKVRRDDLNGKFGMKDLLILKQK